MPAEPRAGSRPLRHAAAVGLAVLDAASLQARPKIDGLRAVNTLAPQPPGDAYATGRGRLAAGDVTGALADFRRALQHDPRSVDALNAMAVCYDRLGRYDISRTYYDSALALAPGSAEVLNNLGYSLTLQGALAAAIPVLRQAIDAGDPAAAANSQRLLTLVAARLRAATVAAETAVTRTEVAAPAARIELAANGEQRLVIGGPAPSAALTASLGDAASLVLVARPWQPRDDAALAARETAADHAAAIAAASRLAAVAPAADAATTRTADAATTRTADAATTRTADAATIRVANAAAIRTTPVARASQAAPAGLATAFADPAAIGVAATLPHRLGAIADTLPPVATDTAVARLAADGASSQARAAAAVVARADASPTIAEARAASSIAIAATPGDADAPVWLLAARRDGRSADRRATTGQGPQADRDAAAFESDDRTLNAFAARMRGVDAPAAAQPAVPDAVPAVARLEALLARLAASAGAA